MVNRKNLIGVTIILFMVLFISACGSSSNQDNTANRNPDHHDTTEEDNHSNDSELTETEAEEMVTDYAKEHENYDPDNYEFDTEEKEEAYRISIFSDTPDKGERGSPIIGRFNVEKTTGEVKELDDVVEETENAQEQISEIADLNKEERHAHYEELAVSPENISDKVYENLLLPGIHENTKSYEGRVNPGEKVRFEFPDAEKASSRSTYDPEISEDGYFTVNVHAYEFKAGQNIRIYITNGYPHEQTFDLPVHEAKEGMENIRVKE